ncbi:RNA-binding region-containing protein 3 [Hydra vulgaris]|uniref:RNA-binding region-containing protein 3 n=1 Tax=Hydra vulgaris TaxID=6087 RepID=T2M6S0_HYDVU|nr:RNA-binding region-containing protein 3 [Hydra vulgaris]
MGSRLIIKNFPNEFSDNDKKQFLLLFGAEEIVCMSQFGKMKNSCFASFQNPFLAKQALESLHQFELLSQKLVAEYAKPHLTKIANKLQSKIILDYTDKKDKSETEIQVIEEEEQNAGICPKLGITHEFPKHLSYQYPEPNVMILTNIANALATIPKFYNQVLHLMNKMNLPPPFSGPTLAPPIPGDSIQLQDVCVDTSDLHSFLSSGESELESDSENATKPAIYQVNQVGSGPLRKRKKLKALPSVEQEKFNILKSKAPESIENTFELTSTTKRFEFKLAASIQEVVEGRKQPQVSYNVFDERGEFGKLQPLTKIDSDESSEEEKSKQKSYISSSQLKENRISAEEILAMTQFKKYTCGERTNRLYIKNLSKQVQTDDLLFIFNRFIRHCSEEEKALLDIRLMQEGRMKGQAFVTFPNETIAEKSLKQTHGYILLGKPMVVQFGKAKDQ